MQARDRGGRTALWAGLVAVSVALALPSGAAAQAPGEIYFVNRAKVVEVDPVSGNQTDAATGGGIIQAHGLQVDGPLRRLLIADFEAGPGTQGTLFGLPLGSSTVEILSEADQFQQPLDVTRAPNGTYLVIDRIALNGALFRVLPNGDQRVVAGISEFANPVAVVALPNGDAIVADSGPFEFGDTPDGKLLRVKPNGRVTTIASGFQDSYGLVLSGDYRSVFVVDFSNSNGGGSVVKVNLATGSKQTVASGGLVDQPYRITREADGSLLVMDLSVAFGRVVRLDPASGSATLLSTLTSGLGSGVAVVPPTCAGRPATMFGTPQGERIVGGPSADVIAGLGGNDTIKGLGRRDVLCGGAGRDKLIGGAKRDRLLGGGGRDRLIGGRGRDVCRGGPGRDSQRAC